MLACRHYTLYELPASDTISHVELEQDVTSGFSRLERSVGLLCFNLNGSEVESKDETFEMCCKKIVAPKVIITLEASFLDESSRY